MSKQLAFKGVVLAGGHSSRMGQDKANLKFYGETLLERAKSSLIKAGAEEVIVVRKGAIEDIFADCGPLGGIHAAIQCAGDKPLAIIPVDLPLLEHTDIEMMVSAGIHAQCISRFKGQFIPLFIPKPKQLLEALTERLMQGSSLSLRHFFKHYQSVEVAPTNADALENANTPDEWQRILVKRS